MEVEASKKGLEKAKGLTLDGDENESAGSTAPSSALQSPAGSVGMDVTDSTGKELLSLIDIRTALQDVLTFYLTDRDIGRLSLCDTALNKGLTVESPPKSAGPRRRLIVPVVELQLTTAEEELARISLPHIRTLRVFSRLSLNVLVAAAKKSPLRSLDRFICKSCPLHPADVKEVLEPLLRATRCLKLLNMERNRLTCDFMVALSKSPVLARIDTLNVRNNNIGNRGAKALANSPHLQSLTVLNFKQNNIGDAGVSALAFMLSKTRVLRLLNLRRQTPALTDVSAIALADALRTNRGLTSLRLRRNRIMNAGAEALAAAALARLTRQCEEQGFYYGEDDEEASLELDLEENKIGDQGAAALLDMAREAPDAANVSVLLFENPVTQESLRGHLAEHQPNVPAENPRLNFENVPEMA